MLNECWSTHVQKGYKMKGGKRVPNCVPRGIKDSYQPEGEVMSERDYGKGSYSGQERITTGGPAAKAGKPSGKGRLKPQRPSKSVEDEMVRANRAGSNYDPTDVRDSYDPTIEFTDRVMREAFDKMTPGELKDYDSKSLKPGSQGGHRRSSTPEERDEYAKRFRKSRGYASQKVKKLRDLDYKKNR